MYRIVCCDLDETLIGYDHRIAQRNVDAIRQATSQGVLFVPATGRGYCTIQKTLEELSLRNRKGQYAISFNGGAITENAGNRLLHLKGLEAQRAELLYERGQAFNVCIHVYTEKTVYVWHLNDDERRYLEGRMEVQEIDSPTLDFLGGEKVVKVLYEYPDYAYLNRVERNLGSLTDELSVSYSSMRYLEFNPKGVDKGAGLAALAQLLGVQLSGTVAIGDNINDLQMIKAAGLGCAVANAVDGLKDACDYVAQADCQAGGVAEVLERFILS
jgi:Cof subfamily protein (haloacid dehalogenase superfamily)